MNLKKYRKPTLEFISFELSSSIASSCSFETVTASDGNSCSIESNGWTLYASDNSACADSATGIVVEDPTFCYHVPTDGMNIFGS